MVKLNSGNGTISSLTLIRCVYLGLLQVSPKIADPDSPVGVRYTDQLNNVVKGCLQPDVKQRWTSFELSVFIRKEYKYYVKDGLSLGVELILPQKVTSR